MFQDFNSHKIYGANFFPINPLKKQKKLWGMMGMVLGWIIFGEMASSAPLAHLPTTTTTTTLATTMKTIIYIF